MADIDSKVQNLNSMVSMLKKYSAKDMGTDRMNRGAMSGPAVSGDYRLPFVKVLLAKNFDNVADNLKLSSHSKNVGNATIDKLVDYCDEVNKATNAQLFNLTTNGFSVIDNSVTAMFKYAINKYGKELNKQKVQLHECGFSANEAKDLTDDALGKFMDKVERMTPDTINKEIAERVSTATKNFIEDRNDKTETIKNIYNKAKEDLNKTDDEGDQARIEAATKVSVNKVAGRIKGIFESLVESMTSYAVKHPEVSGIYKAEDGSVNMELIVEDAQAIYTVLEEANTYGLIKFNDSIIKGIIESFNQ